MQFFVPGNPTGKGRPRFTKAGHVFTPRKTIEYEQLVKVKYAQASESALPSDGPVNVRIHVHHGVPKSATKKDRQKMLAGELSPTKKPDCDNIAKIILDALNGLAYFDDQQVVYLEVRKDYSQTPGVDVTLTAGI